ncbi:MAG: 4Fe-4S binding protein [Terracidiphilus sp.]|nr:4Fe-4S binding protein [Terracidiphilus sp.]
MNILTMLWKNFWGGNRTLQFPARPSISQRFRGLVQLDPEKCIGCGICKNRCTSRAIEFIAGKPQFTWSYNPGQCTFCGRCVEGCKDGALSQAQDTPPVYTHPGELKVSYTLTRKPPAARPAVAKPAAAPAPEANPTTAPAPAANPEPASGGAQ